MELAIDCLNMSRKIWPLLKNNKMEFLSLASTLFDTTWRETKGLFESIHKSLPKIPIDQRFAFITLSEHLVKSNMTNIPAAILEISAALSLVTVKVSVNEFNNIKVINPPRPKPITQEIFDFVSCCLKLISYLETCCPVLYIFGRSYHRVF